MGLVGLNSKPCESEPPAQFNSQKHTCEHFCKVSCSKYIPAGSRPLASWGQKACPSCGLPVTWDKSPPAKTSGVHWGWRWGWRKAARRSPVKGREGGSEQEIGIAGFTFNASALWDFPSPAWKPAACMFHSCVVFCVSQSGCCASQWQWYVK